MVRILLSLSLVIVFLSAGLLADDHSVIFDEDIDFSTFKTFSVGETRITSERPELNFPAVARSVSDSLRAALKAKNIKEVPDHGDLVLVWRVTGVDYSIGPFGRPNANPAGGRGGRGRGRAMEVDFTEATLVVDFNHGTPDTLVWRGVFHDSEKDARKLAEALPKDAVSLVSEFPPAKRK